MRENFPKFSKIFQNFSEESNIQREMTEVKGQTSNSQAQDPARDRHHAQTCDVSMAANGQDVRPRLSVSDHQS